MEERSFLPHLLPAQHPVQEPKNRLAPSSTTVLERARGIAESISQMVKTVEETLLLSDQLFVEGLTECVRDKTGAGADHLTRAMISMVLAVWQLDRLSSMAIANRNFVAAGPRKAAAERQLQFIPGRMQLASASLRASAGGEAAFVDLRSTVSAFITCSDIVHRVLTDSAAVSWNRAFSAACEPTSTGRTDSSVTSFGLPDLAAHSGTANLCGPDRGRGCPGLSTREREVLTQIVAGLTTSEIACRLGVKTTTVATLVGRIFNKLGVNNRPSAVAAALRYGLCTHDD